MIGRYYRAVAVINHAAFTNQKNGANNGNEAHIYGGAKMAKPSPEFLKGYRACIRDVRAAYKTKEQRDRLSYYDLMELLKGYEATSK